MFLFLATSAPPCPAVHPTPPILLHFLVVSLMWFLQAAEGERNIHRLCDGMLANGRLRYATPTSPASKTSTLLALTLLLSLLLLLLPPILPFPRDEVKADRDREEKRVADMAEKLSVYKREVTNCEVGAEEGAGEAGAGLAGAGVAGAGVVAPTPSSRRQPGRCGRRRPGWRPYTTSWRRRQRGQRGWPGWQRRRQIGQAPVYAPVPAPHTYIYLHIPAQAGEGDQ